MLTRLIFLHRNLKLELLGITLNFVKIDELP
jgi:hypothetical protein